MQMAQVACRHWRRLVLAYTAQALCRCALARVRIHSFLPWLVVIFVVCGSKASCHDRKKRRHGRVGKAYTG